MIEEKMYLFLVSFFQGLFLSLIVHFVFMWLQNGDAKPQLIAPTYATVTRTGSITAPKRMEVDAK
jgi:hypothetical protein